MLGGVWLISHKHHKPTTPSLWCHLWLDNSIKVMRCIRSFSASFAAEALDTRKWVQPKHKHHLRPLWILIFLAENTLEVCLFYLIFLQKFPFGPKQHLKRYMRNICLGHLSIFRIYMIYTPENYHAIQPKQTWIILENMPNFQVRIPSFFRLSFWWEPHGIHGAGMFSYIYQKNAPKCR